MMQDHERGASSVLTTLFGHNVWANLKLLDFCAQLSAEQLDATAIGGFGSIRDTLRHIVGSEISYVERVNGKQPTNKPSSDEFPGFEMLQDGVRWAGAELLQLALAARQDSSVQQHSPRQRIAYPLASLIVQAISHSTEHRTQIATIITQLGLEPPDLSGWQYMEEHGELQASGEDAV